MPLPVTIQWTQSVQSCRTAARVLANGGNS